MVLRAELAELCCSLPSISPRAEGGEPVTSEDIKEAAVPPCVTAGVDSATPCSD